MSDEYMITTEDNPFSPFSDFKAWFEFDEAMGYHTTGYLARVINTSEELSEEDQRLAYERAVDEIVEFNLSGKHKRVYRNGR